ncbi:MAG: hypothetical protein DRI01_04545 [Chloroflexi bacterium]|nr:MAG: hypothetical protein DRI01_04545 [Chloroflexota bacterium]
MANKFVKEGRYLLLYIPAYGGVIPYRVVEWRNKDAEFINYGPFPYTASGYPEGVIPAYHVTSEVTFKDITGRYPPEKSSDMFYFTEADRLVHTYIDIRPKVFRVFRNIPMNYKQYSLLGYATADPGASGSSGQSTDFGYSTGKVIEHLFIPNMHVGWILANRTNMDLKTYVRISYVEYKVEIPKDANLIFKMILGEAPAYWYTMPVYTRVAQIDELITKIYGLTDVIPLYKVYERERAMREIPTIVSGARI